VLFRLSDSILSMATWYLAGLGNAPLVGFFDRQDRTSRALNYAFSGVGGELSATLFETALTLFVYDASHWP
jgi:hypothetical protein